LIRSLDTIWHIWFNCFIASHSLDLPTTTNRQNTNSDHGNTQLTKHDENMMTRYEMNKHRVTNPKTLNNMRTNPDVLRLYNLNDHICLISEIFNLYMYM